MYLKNGPPIRLAYLSQVLKEVVNDIKAIDINIDINKKYKDIGKYSRDFILAESNPAVSFAYVKLDEYCQKILSYTRIC